MVERANEVINTATLFAITNLDKECHFLFVSLANPKLLQKPKNQEVIDSKNLSYELTVYSPVRERNSEA